MVESHIPMSKRFRSSIEDDLDQSEHNNSKISPQSHSTMLQLTGKFSIAMDLWADISSPDFEPINNSTIDDIVWGGLTDEEMIDYSKLDDIIWGGVTDEEMNKFWDTLPKKYGGLM